MSAVFLDVGRWTVVSLGISFLDQCKAGMAAAFTVDDILFKANERRERVLHEQVTKALSERGVFVRGIIRARMITFSARPPDPSSRHRRA